MTIKTLFDPSKDIYRAIEKVITYSASQEERLKTEIHEYIVTDSIDRQFEDVLGKMQLAMEQGGQNEVGVWVSGFYGSGKSSFTKYLGLALDDTVEVDGVRFLRHLQDRMQRPQTKALLNTVAARFPAAVVMLDLASEMLAGANMEDVSTVLYYKVLQWAGYSRHMKVAALERRLQKDGRFDEFRERVQQDLGVAWADVQNDPLVIDSLLPEIAHQMYPNLFKTPASFSTESVDFIRFETDRVQEMIDIVREVSGKEYVIFVIDEVGQYVAPRTHLILNLDGLAKNLKNFGDGKVWIIGTAQQTLTEDDPRAALNSAELYRLSARFPIQIDLESSDIKEICTARLLGKSVDGARTLGALFDQHGQALRHNTKLQDARFYDADFDRQAFIDLYPFLPAHFDILLHLLGALAKSTGGIGLRSAIKVIQDVLVEGAEGHAPAADQPVGSLATTVTLFDALEKDIRRAYPSPHRAAGKAMQAFRDSPLHQEIAKTVAILQILGNMPVTVQNVAALMHPSVDAPSRLQQVEAAVKDLISDAVVPFGEKDGNLVLFSQKLNEIDRERAGIVLRTVETRRIQNEALRSAFTPLPSTRLHNSLTVSAGLKAISGSTASSLAGERETIQTAVEFADPTDYETARTRLLEESRQRTAQHTVFLLGRTEPDASSILGEIYRCQEIASIHRNDPDQEVREYCAAQTARAEKLSGELQRLLKRSLSQGSFIFRGQTTAVESLDPDLLAACKKHLSEAAAQVFERYAEAPVRADTGLAEKFLRSNLRATSEIDPLGLVQDRAGTPSIRTDHRALVSIKDYLQRNELVEGKRLTDHFTDAPFGWSQDTLRYMIAALLVAGEVRLKVAGRDVTVNGQQAQEALRTNNSFRTVGVAPRDDHPSTQTLARAAERLTDLVGDTVFPLEEEISKAAAGHIA
ncbi:MAG: BREX system P-loop protein BrxC, partial [Chloroflexota bacterium]|nr:BREX system P-loop protein BrxC [Chloroflexota bacterium]